MTDCEECNNEFERDDTVLICSECKDKICEDCKEEHNCFDEFDEHENEGCSECGETDGEMWERDGNYYCDGCKEELEKAEKKSINFEEVAFEDLSKHEIVENL